MRARSKVGWKRAKAMGLLAGQALDRTNGDKRTSEKGFCERAKENTDQKETRTKRARP
jgi:hypothetical protein